MSPGGSTINPHEFYPEGWPGQEYAAMGYGPPGFPRQPGGGFCDIPDQEQLAMMERMGIPPHMAGRMQHGIQYRGPPWYMLML